MLHEILLSLSGQPSPLFEQHTEEGGTAEAGFPLLSPPEKALLEPLAHLSQLHKKLRSYTLQATSSHPSTICRAAATAISTRQLGSFQKKIIEVEKAILSADAGYVGGYGIVPLSTIVGEFTPWVRRMEWLWDVVRFMFPQPQRKSQSNVCTGNKLIDYLRRESQTGYLDLEEMAMDVIKAAETAWMRQLSMWILYGQLPPGGQMDFFIQESLSGYGTKQQQSPREFTINTDLLPNFVSSSTASSILFIGKSLNHIRSRGNHSAGEEPKDFSFHTTLHGDYIRRLSSLSSPISDVGLSGAVSEIRMSLSQSVLSCLLPLPKIMEVLSVLHDFLLLGRGEFAMALVRFAEKRVQAKSQEHVGNRAASGNLEGLLIKPGEVALVLSHALAELYSLQNEEDPIDDKLDLARELVHLSIKEDKDDQASSERVLDNSIQMGISQVPFEDLLLATPTALSLRLRPPLDLFLAPSDMAIYSKMHAYLLGIKRAQLRLSDLWKLTSLRRTHPTPWGPPLSNKRSGQERLRSRREREKLRASSMRAIWASASAALFVLSELGSYLQGEVIHGSWSHFRQWLERGQPASASSRPGTAKSNKSRGTIASQEKDEGEPLPQPYQHDPETITVAHRTYLRYICESLLLTDGPFTRALLNLLNNVDYFIAQITQLQTVQQNLDLETDEGVVDSLADYAADEKRIWAELRQARTELDGAVMALITRLRDIDDTRLTEGTRLFDFGNENGTGNNGGGEQRKEYVPWKPAGVDRLLMSLDFGDANTRNDGATAHGFRSLVRE